MDGCQMAKLWGGGRTGQETGQDRIFSRLAREDIAGALGR